jgi:hypothetical protein
MPQSNSRLYALVDNNFCNYPLARDARTQQHWRRAKAGHWWCDLPGDISDDEGRIRFRIDGEAQAEFRHCPTGFDINILFLLLGEARRIDKATIVLASDAAMLAVLGLGADTRNRRRLHHSLRYWSMLAIRYKCWYASREGTITKTLPAPIQALDGNQITLHPDWLWGARNKGYWARVRLPLPQMAAAQNLVLRLVKGASEFPVSTPFTLTEKLRTFCRKIGLSHEYRVRQLQAITKPGGAAHAWFKRRGDDLRMTLTGSHIILTVTKDVFETPIERYQRVKRLPAFELTEQRRQRDSDMEWQRDVAERGRAHEKWMDQHHPQDARGHRSLHPRRARRASVRKDAETSVREYIKRFPASTEGGGSRWAYQHYPSEEYVPEIPEQWQHLPVFDG